MTNRYAALFLLSLAGNVFLSLSPPHQEQCTHTTKAIDSVHIAANRVSMMLHDLKFVKGGPRWLHKETGGIAAGRTHFDSQHVALLDTIPLRYANKRPLVVDVGLSCEAHETIAAVRAGFLVLAFEPEPRCFAELMNSSGKFHIGTRAADTARRVDNDLVFIGVAPTAPRRAIDEVSAALRRAMHESGGRGIVVNAGASDVFGHLQLSRERGSSSFVDSFAAAAEKTDVAIVRVDDLVPIDVLRETRVFAVKLDCQGYEPVVLRGMSQLVSKSRYVMTEFWPRAIADGGVDALDDVLLTLTRAGFMCADLWGGLPCALETTEECTRRHSSRFVDFIASFDHVANGRPPGRFEDLWTDLLCERMHDPE